jgi:glycosyltransferase involved in cell wall biosynthesis
MKITVMVHGYPPLQNAGAEWMLHEMLKHLVGWGHSVEVLLPISNIDSYEFEGVKVHPDTFTYTTEAIKTADVVLSHLDRAGKSLNYCEFYHKPFVQIIHNTNDYDILRAKHKELGQGRFIYVIYNSLYTKNTLRFPNPGIIVHPPVDPQRYKVKRGKKLTLINLFERKGGRFFLDLARLMPDYEFLGVEGGYGRQEKDGNLANVEYMENTPDARKIYAKTRILLMPSLYESYGRTGVEAMVSGIPVIASPTPGLQESLGTAGIYCNVDSPLSWVEAIKKLDDPVEYKHQSEACVKRAKEVESETPGELENMERFLIDIMQKRI